MNRLPYPTKNAARQVVTEIVDRLDVKSVGETRYIGIVNDLTDRAFAIPLTADEIEAEATTALGK